MASVICTLHHSTRVLLVLGACSVFASPAASQVTWDAGGGPADKSWGNAANWSGNTIPMPTDLVVFNDTGASNLPGSPTSVLDMARTIGGLSIANTGNHYQTIDLGTNTLQVNGNVDINTNVIDSTLVTIKNGTLDLGSPTALVDLSVGRVTVQGGTDATAALDLTGAIVNGNIGTLTVGEKILGGNHAAIGTLSLGSGGSLNVGSASTLGKIVIGHNATGGGAVGTVDLSQQATFTANVSSLLLGTAEVGTATGTLSLAANNTINSTTIRVGYSTQDDNGTSALHLGTTNTITTSELTIGGRQSSGTLDIPWGGTLNLGSASTPTNLTVAQNGAATGTSYLGTANLSGSTFNATLSALSVGVKTGGGNGSQTGGDTGTLIGGNAGNIIIGSPASPGTITVGQVATGGGGFGTVDLSGENSLVANVSTLLVGTAAGGTATGTLSLPANNTINATTVRVGYSSAGDMQSSPSALHLGLSNTINASEFTIAGQQSNASLDMPIGGTLALGLSGTPTALSVGVSNAATATSFQGTMQLGGGTFNANLSALSVGIKGGGGSGPQTGNETGTLVGGNAGKVVIGSPDALGSIAIGQVAGGGGGFGTVDFSGETTLLANLTTLNVGVAASGSATGTLSLGSFNTINANTIRVGYSTGTDNQTPVSTLHLGMSNKITANEFTIGGRQSSGSLDIPAGGTLALVSGSTPASLNIGTSDVSSNQSESGSMKLTGATFNATLGSLSVGVKTGGGNATETGTLIGGNAGGTIVGSPSALGTVTIGQSSGGGSGTGTVDLSGQTSFTANLSQMIVGQSGNGTLKLPATNIIDTQTLVVGDNGSGTLAFGKLNVLQVDNMQVGNSYSNASVTVAAGGTITIGSNTRPADLSIGKVVINTNSTYSATVDLSNSNVNAWFNNVTVGSRDTSLPGNELARLYGGNAGTINVGTTGNTANMIVGAGANATVDVSQMDNFNANLNQMQLGAGATASVALAKSTNINASSIVVGNNGNATLTLGKNNTILADSLQAGLNYGNGTIQLPVGGVLNLGSQARPTTLVLGSGITNTNSTYTGTLDLSGGTVHAYLGSVTLGQKDSQPGVQSGVLSISNHADNTIVANSIVLGGVNASGTINYGGGDFTAASIAKGASALAANFNWQGGMLHVGTFGTPATHFDLANIGTGTLAPGNSAGTVVGTTQIFGNYTQQSSATMQIDLGGTQPGTGYDSVAISNAANLAGTLAVHLMNGFQPTLNEIFTPLTFGLHAGNFTMFTGLYVGDHLTLVPVISAGNLELIARPTVSGDINLDGIVNGQDLAMVSSNWLTNSPSGDVNGDGIVNGQDLAVISANWLATDPGNSASALVAPVPEPATYLLAVIGAAAIFVMRRARHG